MSAPIDLSFLRDRVALRRIAVIAVAFTLAGALYAFLAPRWYRAALTVVPAKPQKAGGLSSMLSGELAGLAAGLGASVGDSADVQRIAAVLQSTSVTDAAIERFALKDRYDEKYQEKARQALWEHCDVRPLPKPGLVRLSCEDKDPRFVQQLVSFFAEHGNEVFRRVSVSSATEQVRFLERRVAELRTEAEASAARMREFQEKHKIVDIETQTKAVVGAIASLNAQRIGKQLELDYARKFSGGNEPTTRQLESQLEVVNRKLRALEEADPDAGQSSASDAGGGGMFPVALTVPKLRAEFETLYRDRKVAESTLVFALEKLESAKAEEVRDTSTFLVLDAPTVPTMHSWPRQGIVISLALLVGLLVGAVFEWWSTGGLRVYLSRRFVIRRAA